MQGKLLSFPDNNYPPFLLHYVAFFVPDNAPRYGTVRRLGREAPVVNGQVQFDDSLEVEIDVQDVPKRTVKLDKLNINTKQGVDVRVRYTVCMHQCRYSVSVVIQIFAF